MPLLTRAPAAVVVALFLLPACEARTGESVPPDSGRHPDALHRPDGSADGGVLDDTIVDTPDLSDQVRPDAGNVPVRPIESPELVIKIVDPSARRRVAITSRTIALKGIVTGLPDSITWHAASGAAGEASGVPFWRTTAIPLLPGDNLLTVTAVRGDEVQTDQVLVTVNTSFKFGSRLQARPDVLFVGHPKVRTVFTIGADLYRSFVPGSIRLVQTDAAGLPIASSAVTMKDDGQTQAGGDEIEGDGVHTASVMLEGTAPGALHFRVQATVKNGGREVQALSETLDVEVVAPVTAEECRDLVALQAEAESTYQAALQSAGHEAAVAEALQTLQDSPRIGEAGVTDGSGVWLRSRSGLLGALRLSAPGYRGGPGGLEQLSAGLTSSVPVGNRRALLLSPYAAELGEHDESQAVAAAFGASACPPYEVSGPLEDGAADLRAFQDLWRHGLVSVATHGGVYFSGLSVETKRSFGWFHMGAQELLWTGEPVDCAAFSRSRGGECTSDAVCGAGARCVIQELNPEGQPRGLCVDYLQADLRRGRLVLGAERYGVLPTFFRFHSRDAFPGSVVHLGACRSAWNGSMAAMLFGMGARAILGYTGAVTSAFAAERGRELFERLLPDPTTGEGLVLGQAHLNLRDPDTDSTLRLIGARNLVVPGAGLVNGSFETGEATGWKANGDGRVISLLGPALPVHGKHMAILSTGLGYTTKTGELSQTFCPPEGATTLTFWWRFFSAELFEWCGSNYQDTFRVELETAGAVGRPIVVTIDGLCPATGCPTCGSWRRHYPSFPEIVDCPIDFDQGDVKMMEDWFQSRIELSDYGVLAGEPVTLRLMATDKGDSIYDSAILVDDVKVQ